MTEKRYDLVYEKEPRGQVVTDNGIPCTARTCCTRLNWLEEENEQLKDALNQRTDQCDKYYKENEQLKQKIKTLQDTIDGLTGTMAHFMEDIV